MQIDKQKNNVPQTSSKASYAVGIETAVTAPQLIEVTNWRTVVIVRRKSEGRQQQIRAHQLFDLGRIEIPLFNICYESDVRFDAIGDAVIMLKCRYPSNVGL